MNNTAPPAKLSRSEASIIKSSLQEWLINKNGSRFSIDHPQSESVELELLTPSVRHFVDQIEAHESDEEGQDSHFFLEGMIDGRQLSWEIALLG